MRRQRLSTKAREELYDAARGDLEHPPCNLCSLPVRPGERWHESHWPIPHALDGKAVGVAHAKCNLFRAHKVETPLIAHVKRARQKHIGAFRSRFQLPGGRDDPRRKTIRGQVVDRRTGEAWHTNRRGA